MDADSSSKRLSSTSPSHDLLNSSHYLIAGAPYEKAMGQITDYGQSRGIAARYLTPSPTRALSPTLDNIPRIPLSPNTRPLSATLAQSILHGDSVFTSPRQISIPLQTPLSPRPIGPRSPIPGPTLAPTRPATQLPTIGSAHTRLRIVSGGGRRISIGRETIPLKGGEENESSESQSTPTSLGAAKRQHSADNLTPRKRSPTHIPLHPLEVPDSAKSSLSLRSGSRRTSGKQTRRSSGPLTNARTVSASQASIVSTVSTATVEDGEMKEFSNVETALEASSKKRLKSEIAGLRKQMTKDAKGKDLVQRLERNSSLPRSPQRRNMNEIDAIVMDECARGIASVVERVDTHLRHAEASNSQAVNLAKQLATEKDQAFNTELDGMFDDAQLPETEAFQALKSDLQITKAGRNLLELENKKLKRELEEANLKRDQWARMLRAQGYKI
ncbi:uncharacterized protein IL334_005890 [Kwoniella shivajii]|uniref:Uncharacterized protein n=1 Tax=Kwoniella shivajii TaxID=564305 RepID=A0ABZ1D526_9TREE|nr:hypothetical protein IL334_005890 [Kwoniella shivajii]